MYLVNLKSARLEAGLSQVELAELVGITGPMVSYLESCRRTPSFGVAVRLAEALDTTLDGLTNPRPRSGVKRYCDAYQP